MAVLRTASRALRAASRARAAVRPLVDDALGDAGVGVEVGHQAVVDDGGDDAFDLGVDEFDLGLGLEAGVGEFDAEDADEAFADVVAGDRGVLFLEEAAGAGVLVDRAGEGGAEAGEVGAAVGVGDRVGEAEDLVGVAVVVLHDAVDDDFLLAAGEDQGLGVEDFLVAAELFDEFGDAVLVEEAFALVFEAFVGEFDFDAGVEEGEFAEAVGEEFEFELGGDREDLGVGFEGDERSGVTGLADDLEPLGRLAAAKPM
jgi:hypothetical protein